MMKTYVVLQAFIDRLTGVRYEVGDTYPADTSAERLAELMGDELPNFVGPVIESGHTNLIHDVEDDKPTDKSKISEIKDYLDAHNIEYDAKAKKADLLALI